MNRDKIRQELEEARHTFHQLVRDATAEDLRRPSQGTRWTNRQLLFHMVFGYLIVRTLLPLVHTLGRHGWSRRFAIALNAPGLVLEWRRCATTGAPGSCSWLIGIASNRLRFSAGSLPNDWCRSSPTRTTADRAGSGEAADPFTPFSWPYGPSMARAELADMCARTDISAQVSQSVMSAADRSRRRRRYRTACRCGRLGARHWRRSRQQGPGLRGLWILSRHRSDPAQISGPWMFGRRNTGQHGSQHAALGCAECAAAADTRTIASGSGKPSTRSCLQ